MTRRWISILLPGVADARLSNLAVKFVRPDWTSLSLFLCADFHVGDAVVSNISAAAGNPHGNVPFDIAIADSGIGVFFQNPASPGVLQSQIRILDDE